jgi:hypothetical protein
MKHIKGKSCYFGDWQVKWQIELSMIKIAGAIYPIPLKFVNRIFAEQRNVFVKYVVHESGVKLVPNNKVLFYASRGQKEIVGEATIKAVEFLTPVKAFEKYGDKLFLNKDELMKYASQPSSRTASKKMLVLVLFKPRKYLMGIKYARHITKAGEYFTDERYNALVQQAGVLG